MTKICFGARVEVGDLSPNRLQVENKIQARANNLRKTYQKIDDNDLRIDLQGVKVQVEGKKQNTMLPSVNAFIQVRTAPDRFAQTSLNRNVSYDGVSAGYEPLWKFFWRVRRETNKLIATAGLKQNKLT